MKQITIPVMKKIADLVLVLVVITGLSTGCSKDREDPPVLPPVESMTIDFSNFDTEKKRAVYSLTKGIENVNWEFSALVAGYWNSIIVTTLAIPVITFNLATDETPVYVDDKTWEWRYEPKVFTATYQARLTGQVRTQDVEWKMYVAREGSGGFSEFLWIQGTSKLDGTGGQWILNHSSSYQEPVLQIDWTGTSTTVETVKYTYVRALNDSRVDDPFRNSYIEFGKQSSGPYDAYFNIYYHNGLDFSEMQVEWNITGRNGRVKCEKFFADDAWHCWNGNYVNIICPD